MLADPKEINKNPENVELMHIRVKNEQELKELMDDDEYDVFLKELAGVEQGEEHKGDPHAVSQQSTSGDQVEDGLKEAEGRPESVGLKAKEGQETKKDGSQSH